MASDAAAGCRIRIRPAQPGDIARLAAILRESPETVNWLPDLADAPPAPGPQRGGIFLVAEPGGEVAGFVLGRVTANEAEILNIAVDRSRRREGVASKLLTSALELFCEQDATRVFLEVRESNAAAIAFYEKHGFHQTGRRRHYYRNPDEDALLFERKLTD